MSQSLTINSPSDINKITNGAADVQIENINVKEDLLEVIVNKHIKNVTFENCQLKEARAEFFTKGIKDLESVTFSNCTLTHLYDETDAQKTMKIEFLRFVKRNGVMTFLTYDDKIPN